MTAPQNLSFEEQGDAQGLALGWSSTFVSTARALATFRRYTFEPGAAVDGVLPLPGWLSVSCPTENRTIQASLTQLYSGLGADAARARSLDGVTYGLAAEKASVNLSSDSSLAGGGDWSVFGTPTLTVPASPALGIFTPAAIGIEDQSAVASEGVSNSSIVVVDTGSPHTVSTWMRNLAPTPTTGAGIIASFTSSVTLSTTATDPDWTFRSASGNLTGASGTLQLAPRRLTGADLGTCYFWGVQLESGGYPTSYIGDVNVDGNFTRAADTVTADALTVAPNGHFDIVMAVRFHYAQADVSSGEHDLIYFDADNRVYYDLASSEVRFMAAGADAVAVATTWARDTVVTFRAVHQADRVALTITGALSGNGTTVVTAAQAALSLPLRVGLLGGPSGSQESADLMSLSVGASQLAVETFESDWGNHPFIKTLGVVETFAQVTSTLVGPFVLADSQTLIFNLDVPQASTPVTFSAVDFSDITNATALEVASSVNDQTSGLLATLDLSGRLVLTSSSMGTSSRIGEFTGTAGVTLGFADQLSQGVITGAAVESVAWDLQTLLVAASAEDFENAWGEWSSEISLAAQATFDLGSPANVETFESEWSESSAAATATNTLAQIASTSHGLINNDRVRFVGAPTPFDPAVLYWVINANEDDFQVSLIMSGGSVVATGTGALTWYRGHVSTFQTTIATSAGATFDAELALAQDSFAAWANHSREFTPSGTTAVFATPPATHLFQVDDVVVFTTTSALPAPLSTGVHYFVVARGLTTISVSATKGGGALTLTGGTGTHTVTRPYRTSFTTTAETEGALFGGSAAEEDFEAVKAPQTIAVTPASDLVLVVGHGFSNGDTVSFETTGALPGSIRRGQNYLVVSANTDDFQLEQQLGSGALDITDHGTGIHTVIADPTLFWTTLESI